MKITHRRFARKAKYKVLDPDYEQVEMKIDHKGTQGLIYLGRDGWDIREYEKRGGKPGYSPGSVRGDTRGLNVRLSLNSPLSMTWQEWDELVYYVNMQRNYL